MRIWIGVGAFLGVLIIGFAFFVFRISEGPVPSPSPKASTTEISDVHVSDTYKKGVHTVKGTATVPTACTTLTATSSVIEEASTSESIIRIDLSAEPDTGTCLKLPTEMKFSITQSADHGASIAVYANGEFATGSTSSPQATKP